MKSKMLEFFDAFKASNTDGYEHWMSSETPGLASLGKTRTVLMGCGFITHQEAIESVKMKKNASHNHGGGGGDNGSNNVSNLTGTKRRGA